MDNTTIKWSNNHINWNKTFYIIHITLILKLQVKSFFFFGLARYEYFHAIYFIESKVATSHDALWLMANIS